MKILMATTKDRLYTDATVLDVKKLLGIPIMMGQAISHRFPDDISVRVDSSEKPSDFFKAGRFPIASGLFRQIACSNGVRAEWFKVNLIQRGETSKESWYCFNIPDSCDALDREKSIYKTEGEYITEIQKVTFSETHNLTLPAFVSFKTIPPLIIFQDAIARALSKVCTGAVFVSPEQWQDPVNPVPW